MRVRVTVKVEVQGADPVDFGSTIVIAADPFDQEDPEWMGRAKDVPTALEKALLQTTVQLIDTAKRMAHGHHDSDEPGDPGHGAPA